MSGLRVAVAGLGFGAAFVEIYRDHPDVSEVALFDPDIALAAKVAGAFGIKRVYERFDEMLMDEKLDAVHLVSPIPRHAEQAVSVLRAGKHCACTVPMAITLDDIANIVREVRRTGLTYMMMETTLYTYQFLYLKRLIERGELGRIQFMRGSHYQDMANWPEYWLGLPPMYYGTHAIGPMVSLSGSRIKRVTGVGSGSMAPELAARYGNPFPVESALLHFENGMKGEATRSLFETARVYQEGLFVYGSDMSFEWGFADGDLPYVTKMLPPVPGRRGREASVVQMSMPNFHQSLPEPIQRYTVGNAFDPLNPQDSLSKGTGGGHHGSHPHLVNEFVRSIVEGRKPAIDEMLGANITATGICAHLSAMRDGEAVDVPTFT